MKFNAEPLDNYLDLITYGFTTPMPDTNFGPWKVTAKDIIYGKINYDTARKTSEEAYQALTTKSKPQIGDILITKDGTLGRVAIVDRKDICINQSVALLRCNHRILSKYLMYLLQTPKYQEKMIADSDGTTIKHIYITRVNKMLVEIPEIHVQKSILDVLTPLDDKIELNQRINDNLQQQIDLLYDNMFAGETDFVDLGTVVDTTSGGTPSRKHPEFYENPSIGWVKSKELNGGFIHNTEEKINGLALSKSSAKILPSHSVLVAMYGATVGEYGVIASSMACNQAICALIPNTRYSYPYLYELMRHSKDQLKNMAVGSAQQNISQVLIKQLSVHANIHKVEQFSEITAVLFQTIEDLTLENLRLALLRDTLLPKLMSGEIDASNINH